MAGLGGFDSSSGSGMALSFKEAGKAGKIKITTVDAEPEHLRLVKVGMIDYLVGQKRELFSLLSTHFLFELRHGTLEFSTNDARSGVVLY